MRHFALRILGRNDAFMYFELHRIQQANPNQEVVEVVEEEAVEGLGPKVPPPLPRHPAGRGVDLQ